MEAERQGGKKLVTFISDYAAPTNICFENYNLEQRKDFIKILMK